MNITGIRTKNITFNAKVGQRSYRLSTQQSVGIPDNNLIIGFSVRFNYDGAGYKSVNGRKLINLASVVSSYLNLRGWGIETYLGNANLFNFVNVPDYGSVLTYNDFSPYQSLIEPIPAKKISWTKSSIDISNEAATQEIDNDMDFEIIVYHVNPNPTTAKIPITQNYLGKQIAANYHQTIQVDLPSSVISPNVATVPFTFDGKSGIDANAIIYGIRAMQFDYQTFDGNGVPATNTYGSAFLSFKSGDTLLFDSIPIVNVCPQRFLDLPYLMVEPTRANNIDWQGTKIFISDNNSTGASMSFLFQFFYYYDDNKDDVINENL